MPDISCRSVTEAFSPELMQLVNIEVINSSIIEKRFILYLYSRGLRLLNCQVRSRLKV